MNQERLKTVLKTIYNNKSITTDDLYKKVLIRECNEPIVNRYYERLINLSLYLYHKNNDLQELTNIKLPFIIPKDITFEEFCNYLEKYHSYKVPNDIIPNDTVFFRLHRAITIKKKLISIGFDNWLQFDKSALENNNIKKTDDDFKIYLPIANESLSEFASNLLSLCHQRNINYSFKINTNPNVSRSDNVVIYATKDNLFDYIEVIKYIISKRPNTVINYDEQHLLSYPYNSYISISPNLDDNITSTTEALCETILSITDECNSEEEFIEAITRRLKTFLDNKVGYFINNEPNKKI